MERHPIIRTLFTLMLALGLVFALSACGGAVLDPEDLLQEEQEIVDTGPGETTYDQPATVDGQPVTDEDDIEELLEDAGPGTVLEGDFAGYNFDGMDLSGFVLNGGMFDGASFIGTKLNGAEMRYGSFVGANFTNARLQGADMSYGNFTLAIFIGAEMPGESFETTGSIFDRATWTQGQTCATTSIGTCDY